MRTRLLLATAGSVLCGSLIYAATLKPDLAKDGDRWWGHIQVLASDAMGGRDTGSPGDRAAADYVASEFARAGLKPGGVNGGYIQPVKLKVAQIIEDESSLTIVRGPGNVLPLKLGDDATLTVRAGLAERMEADAVFCGYGLSIPEYNYDDFAGLDLKGKICLYIASAPDNVPGNLRAHYMSRGERWKAVQKAGAIGLLAIQNPKDVEIPWERASLRRLSPFMELAESRFNDSEGQQFGATLNPASADKLFMTSGHTFAELLAIADQGKQLPRFPINARIRTTEHMKITEAESQNVIGILPGSDPMLKDEYVVYGAHLDHLGVGFPVPGDAKNDRIYNGAIDDGSGVASLIEVATLMRDGKLKPKRSVLFIAVTGEEKGMLGSQYFNADPTIPANKMVAEINMDMYLPLYPLKILEIYGGEESTLGDDIRAVAKQEGVAVIPDREPQRRLFIRSDQYSFIKQGVPAIFFKFGWEPGSPEEKMSKAWLRERYHAPSDDVFQPVDKSAAAKYNHIMAEMGLRVANAKARPHWNDDSFFKRFAKN
jgi:Zn-dependent M28 family amino/carboxypeptidase